jgi:hypothetical protein
MKRSKMNWAYCPSTVASLEMKRNKQEIEKATSEVQENWENEEQFELYFPITCFS